MEALLQMISREDRTTFNFLAPIRSFPSDQCVSIHHAKKESISEMTGVNFAGLKWKLRKLPYF